MCSRPVKSRGIGSSETLRGVGVLLATDVSGHNIGSIFKYQAIQVPRTFLCRSIIADGKATKLRGDQVNEMAARIVHQIHISRLHPCSTRPSAIYILHTSVSQKFLVTGPLFKVINI